MAVTEVDTSAEEHARLKQMEAFMLADLGRSRQEELPLSENSKGSYNPDRRRNNQIKLSAAASSKLKSGWGNPIRDEEAEQTDGLVIEDAPWRRGRQPMNIIKATPRPRPAGPPKPLHGGAVAAPPIKPAAPPASTVAKGPKTSFEDQLRKARGQCHFDFADIPDIFEKVNVYWGVLLVRPSPTGLLPAHFRITLYNEANKPIYCRLTLESEGLTPREHDVSQMNRPYIDQQKGCCVLATSGPVADHSYYVQLQDDGQTRDFADCLHGLQTLIHKMKAAALLAPTAPTGPPAPKEPPAPPQEDMRLKSNDSANSTAITDVDLVDFDNSQQPVMDVKAIVEGVAHLDQVTDDLAALCSNPHRFGILDAITDEFYKNRYPEMDAGCRLALSSSLQDMIKRHVGAKRQERICEPGPKRSGLPESLQDIDRHLKYTGDDLQALRGRAVLPKPEEETLSPSEAKIIWRPQASKTLDSSRWSA